MILVKEDAFKSIILMGENDTSIRVDEGNAIRFTVEQTGEDKVGVVTKIAGSKKERKFQLLPVDSACEELWSVFAIAENTLKVAKSIEELKNED